MSRGGWLTAYNSVCVYVCVVLLGEDECGRDKKSERERERETALSGGGPGMERGTGGQCRSAAKRDRARGRQDERRDRCAVGGLGAWVCPV